MGPSPAEGLSEGAEASVDDESWTPEPFDFATPAAARGRMPALIRASDLASSMCALHDSGWSSSAKRGVAEGM